MRTEIETLNNSENIAAENRKLLDKIDFRQKRFKKSKHKLKYFTSATETKAKAEKYVAKVRNKILKKFENEKNELHDQTDPEWLHDLSYVFDVRLWVGNLFRTDQDENADQKNNEVKRKIEEDLKKHSKFFDENEEIAKDFAEKVGKQIVKCIDKIIEKRLTAQIYNEEFISDQWNLITTKAVSTFLWIKI